MSYVKIDKFDGNNYESWKIHMRAVLINTDLWDYTSGRKKDTSTEKAEDLEWIRMDEKALSHILLHIESNQLLHVKNCKTSKDAWDVLEKIFEETRPAQKVSLFTQLIKKKTTDDSNIRGKFKLKKKLWQQY